MTFGKWSLRGLAMVWFAVSLMRLFAGDTLASESALSLALLALLLAPDRDDK